MRITNKIIQNNSLSNINTNKVLQDKLSNMISSEKKINRPSDDPIIALRSLRLRTSVNQTDQYRTKNVEDAKSWLTVTEDAIGTLSDIITDVRKQYVKGANDPLTVSDRRIIYENLQSLSAEIYNTGNADFAGRSVFTGYRTDTTLTYSKDSEVQFTTHSFVSSTGTTHTNTFDYGSGPVNKDFHVVELSADPYYDEYMENLGKLNYTDDNGKSTKITASPIYVDGNKASEYIDEHPDEIVLYYSFTGETMLMFGENIRLATSGASLTYGRSDSIFNIEETLDTATLDTIQYVHQEQADETKVTNNEIIRLRLSYDKLSKVNDLKFTVKDGTTGKTVDITTANLTTVSSTAEPNPFDHVLNNPGKVVFVPETGELLFGKECALNSENNPIDLTPESFVSLKTEYQKEEWSKGDLRPQHYFKCTDITDLSDVIKYNYESTPDQEICYNVGVNQSIRINTTANECFNHSIVREIDDVIRAIDDVEAIEAKIKKLEDDLSKISEVDEAAKNAKQDEIDAAKKAQTFLNERLHSLFSKGIAFSDEHLAANSLALTNCGTRSKRLELIENRLDTQLSTLKELKSENEDADMAETAIRLSSAKYAYDASLMATSKAIQQTLLNYL